MRLVSVPEASQILGLKEYSFYDARMRQRLGLPQVRIGKGILFRESDILALIERCTERLLPLPSEEESVDAVD
jgi:predicted DNA-binding transcriptional regulator AlpA